MKFGINLYAERGFENNLGLGIRYGFNVVRLKNVTHRGAQLDRRFKGFNGMVLKYNHSLINQWSQLELGFQRGTIINLGVFISNTNFEQIYSIGIKPIIGVSYFNIELNYGYYMPFNEWVYVNRNNVIIAYRIPNIIKTKSRRENKRE